MSLTAKTATPGQNPPASDEQLLELQGDIRSAAAIAYGLRRHEQIQQRMWVADALEELENELLRIERKLGGPQRAEVGPIGLGHVADRVQGMAHDAGPVMAAQIGALVSSVRGLELAVRQASSTGYDPVQKTG